MTAEPHPAAVLVEVLAAEIGALELLHYRVAQAAGIAAAGRHRFLAVAADQVLDAVAELAALELVRALVVSDVAVQWDLGGEQPSLAELVAAAPGEWRPVLAGLEEQARRLVAEVDEAAGQGTAAAVAGVGRVRTALVAVDGSGYGPDGSLGGLAGSGAVDRVT